MPKFFLPPGTVCGSFLTLDGENAAHARVLRLKPGETVTVWGEYDNWYVVEYDGIFGYVRDEYLRLAGETVIQPR